MTSHNKTRKLKAQVAVFLMIFASAQSFAARIGFDGFSENVCIDLPEGFRLVDSSGSDSFQLRSEVLPVNGIVRIFDRNKYKDTRAASEDMMKKLGADYESETFTWRNNEACVSLIEGNIGGLMSHGISAAAIVPENRKIIFIIAWSEDNFWDKVSGLAASLVDSLYVDSESYFCPGLITSYAYPDSGTNVEVNLSIDGKKIRTVIDESDKEASEYLIAREYEILKCYAERNDWQEAWKRYYRMIFRDSCTRLAQASFDIGSALAPDCADETDLATKLLNWTQTFKYEREKTSSDFASLPSILLGGGSDCDARSMLLCVLLQDLGYDSIMFVSAVHSHSIAGFVSDHPGFGFEANGKTYLTGETTVKNLGWGKIAQNQNKREDWIEILVP